MKLPLFPIMLRSTHNRRVAAMQSELDATTETLFRVHSRSLELARTNSRLLAENARRSATDEKLAIVDKQIRKQKGKK